MASLQTLVSPRRRAAAKFIGQVRRRLLEALDDRPNLKRTSIADALEVHRSVITKHLSGTQDMSLGRVAELAWALGYKPELLLLDLERDSRSNLSIATCPAFEFSTTLSTFLTDEENQAFELEEA